MLAGRLFVVYEIPLRGISYTTKRTFRVESSFGATRRICKERSDGIASIASVTPTSSNIIE